VVNFRDADTKSYLLTLPMQITEKSASDIYSILEQLAVRDFWTAVGKERWETRRGGGGDGERRGKGKWEGKARREDGEGRGKGKWKGKAGTNVRK
jgi:hypothetical protein